MDDMELWFMEKEAVYSTLALFYRGSLSRGLKILRGTDLLKKLFECKNNLTVCRKAEIILDEINENHLNSKYKEELSEDYQRLFIGPGHILAPMWESVYESKDRLIFGKSELSVRRFYGEFGLGVSPKEPADHLAFELFFMARLCDVKMHDDLQNIVKALSAMEKFLKDHLCKWVPVWRECVNSSAKTRFWIEFSNMTEGWIMDNLKEIKEIRSLVL
ncbi:TorD/DmsD family molecular chaperone [Clostridium sp. JNZ X4-2]